MTHRWRLPRPAAGGLSLLLLLLLSFIFVTSLAAQVEGIPSELRGIVLRAGEPFGGVEVVLHRVDALEAGAIDTLATAGDGTFRFVLPTASDSAARGEIHFASVDHEGVLYFGVPISSISELDSLYRIEVFDTLTVPPGGAHLPVVSRYLLVEPAGEVFGVTDLIEIEVPAGRTLVPADSGSTWRYRLPTGARDPQVSGGDISPAATTFPGDSVAVAMPLMPGARRVVLRYTIDSLALTIPLPGETGEIEVLVREPAPPLDLEGLVAVEPVELEPGVAYRRFAAADLTDSTVSLRPGESTERELPIRTVVIMLALALTAAGIWAVRSGAPAAPGASAASGGTLPEEARPPGETREGLLLRVARLDEEIDRSRDPETIERLRREREAAITRLTES
ncbi:MAG: hypothetical protein RQ745_08970 [Longimicrobiales bacterium]|nr:hypothetical protein [Longimicrobiales bacterium]